MRPRTMPFTRRPCRRAALVCGLGGLLAVPPAVTAQNPQVLLDFCLENGDHCAMSIHHVTQGWERHYNADRLQTTASTYKVFLLLAYADAVSRGEIDPDRLITREEWGRFWAGFDGNSLARAYTRLGEPVTVRLDDLVGAMIRESDNAVSDLLLDLLGPRAVARSIKRWVPGFHDVPQSINAIFATYDNHPLEPAIGPRIVADYSGFETAGYRSELDFTFAAMHAPAFVEAIRLSRCQYPPWEIVPPGCVPDFRTNAQTFGLLNNHFFVRATTRSYNQVMLGVLRGDLFPSRMQEVVARHLEYRLDLPAFSEFTRYGAKGGSLNPLGVRNWTTFVESAETGDQVVVSVQLRDIVSGSTSFMVALAERMALDPAFAEHVRTSLPEDPELPELTGWLDRVDVDPPGKGRALKVTADVRNASPFPVHSQSVVHLYFSDDAVLDPSDVLVSAVAIPALPGYGTRKVVLSAPRAVAALPAFVLVVIDAGNTVDEGEENNNVVWERVGG